MNIVSHGLILVFLFLISVGVGADVTKEDDHFSALCIEEMSTGFLWKDGVWDKRNFTPEKLLVKKLAIEKPLGLTRNGYPNYADSGTCWRNLSESYSLSDNETVVSACYNVRDFGSPFYNFNSEVCQETWKNDPGTDKHLESISCKHFAFRVNGWFHHTNFHDWVGDSGITMDKFVNHKDSLMLSVGKCSKL
jgi:hypothetical protein